MGDRPLEDLARPGRADAYREVLGVMAGEPVDWGAHAGRG
jgi:hypothetical protein